MSQFKTDKCPIGIGASAELSLRVSAAALARVVFQHPVQESTWLALERTATVIKENGKTEVVLVAKPFGGGVCLNEPGVLKDLVGDFHFDSHRSRDEMDLRLMIRPADWEIVREFCLRHLIKKDSVLETTPERELKEEFFDALGINLCAEQYISHPLYLVIENDPSPTLSYRSPGVPTVRIYHVSEIKIIDPYLVNRILKNSLKISAHQLMETALENARSGGKGRANGVLALPLEDLLREYLQVLTMDTPDPVMIADHLLDGNVPAILTELETDTYKRVLLS